MEEAALTSHMKGKKHVEWSPSDPCIKSLMPPAPAPPLIIFRFVNDPRYCARAGRHAGNIANFTENRAGKSFFSSKDPKETCP